MDFQLTEEQRMWQQAVRDLCVRQLRPSAADHDQRAELNRPALKAMAPMGLLGMLVPQVYGGAELDAISMTLAIEEKERLPLTDCLVSSPQYSQQVEARCGTLSVPENPSDLQGRQVDINIAVVPAIKRVPEPDPLFVLAGGPGQSVVEVFPFMYTTLFRIHQTRDIVLVDPRGTGKSNPLRCMDPEQDMVEEQQAIAVLQSCPEKLNADLKYYTTDIAMQDLDAVRAALGYERVNLYGVSYGTRAALVYLKSIPNTSEAIVLDAVVDPAFVLYQDIAQDGQGALDLFFARCEADEKTFFRPVAGAIAFAATAGVVTDIHPVLALTCGLLVAGGVHTVKSAIVRPVVTATTAGAGNTPVSLLEDITATVVSFLSILIPILMVFIIVLFVVLIVMWRNSEPGLTIPPEERI